MKELPIAALILGAVLGCAHEQANPDSSMKPDPYYLPRHVNLPAAPLGLSAGPVELRDDCLYLGHNLLIWPEEYSLARSDGEAVVVGHGMTIGPGDYIEVGGGGYATAADLPSHVIGGRLPPCPGPFLWVGEIHKTGPGESG